MHLTLHKGPLIKDYNTIVGVLSRGNPLCRPGMDTDATYVNVLQPSILDTLIRKRVSDARVLGKLFHLNINTIILNEYTMPIIDTWCNIIHFLRSRV